MRDLQSNKLISEFMGLKPNRHNQDPLHPTDFAEYGGKFIKYSDMEYHTSWDWLMPVLEEIDHLQHEPVQGIEDALSTRCIEGTYRAVVEFIKLYNTQTQEP